MKTINKFLTGGLLAVAMVASGCSDSFLEVNPKAQETVESYFTNAEHIGEAVVAAYDPLHWPDWAMGQYNPLNIMSDIMADDLWVGGSDRTDNKYWHLMMNFEALPTDCMSGIWVDFYSGVKRCNDVLEYLETADETVTDEIAAYYEAQVRVLRSFYYTYLWKFWGNIPYYEKNLNEAPYIAEQIKADQVYANIIADLETAIAIDALPMRETPDNYGRVTKAMAYMLYAEIVMYQNDDSRYGTALKYMEEIIASPDYDLDPDYGHIFTSDGEWGPESIFEVNYKSEGAVRSYSNPQYPGGTVLPRLISPNAWKGDTHGEGWGFCPVRIETVERYASNDTRRDATCWNAAEEGTYNPRYQDTGWFLEKYAAQADGNSGQKADADLNFNNNLRIYRYSETLLNAAELILRGASGSGSASNYLKQVRNRAGLDDGSASIDNIIEERHLEFVGEGKRYWDLVRTGKAASVLVPDEYGYRTNTWSESKKYLPIPQSEIDAAQNTLTQNNY